MICPICPRHCELSEGQTGFCRARANVDGRIVCVNYGRVTALALDPIEKKPLARFHPSSFILSAGSFGCNLRCPFCQNYDISMADARCPSEYISPEALVRKALSYKNQGNIGLAYTYNEPLVGYEYVRDCAQLAREAGLVNVLVTNGMICEEPLTALLPLIDALNIDLKGFSSFFYDFVDGDLETVKKNIELSARGSHVEVTTLIIPGMNDREAEMDAEAEWLASIDPEISLHISRFSPRYHLMDKPPTPVSTIYRLRDVAKRHLRYVYTGNC